MRRGEICMVEIPGPVGRRPAIAISLGSSDSTNPLVIIVPLTKNLSQTRHPFTFSIEPTSENGLDEESVVLVSQLGAIEKTSVGRSLGRVENVHMRRIEQELKNLLRLT